MLSAHAALGHEWDLVVIAGLQDGLWPNTVPRGGVLATQRLLDVLDGVAEDASVRAPLLAEERRLLVAAMGRARRRLLVTAVDSDDRRREPGGALPSAFFYELAQWAPTTVIPLRRNRSRRRGCCRPPRWWAGCAAWYAHRTAPSMTRCVPVRQRNWPGWPKAGVPGADPAGWHGLHPGQHQRTAVRSEAIPSR